MALAALLARTAHAALVNVTSWLRRLVVLAALPLASTSLALSSCAPQDAARIRSDDPITLSPSGIHYRPNASLGIIAAGSSSKGAWSEKSDKNFSGGPELRAKETRRAASDLFLDSVYYPFSTSGFFLGLGLSHRKATLSWNEEAHGGEDGVYSVPVSYDERSTSIGLPVGFTWIWGWGGTVHLNVGPYFFVTKKRSFTSGDDGSGVDEAERDETVKKIHSLYLHERETYRAGYMMFGFSF